VHAEGDHIVHVAPVERDGLELDPRFHVNFNSAFRTGPARPHGLAFKQLSGSGKTPGVLHVATALMLIA
jgi:hypothetical protein